MARKKAQVVKRTVREIVRGLIPWNARTARMEWLYLPRPGHIAFPPGYKARLAARHALGTEPES